MSSDNFQGRWIRLDPRDYEHMNINTRYPADNSLNKAVQQLAHPSSAGCEVTWATRGSKTRSWFGIHVRSAERAERHPNQSQRANCEDGDADSPEASQIVGPSPCHWILDLALALQGLQGVLGEPAWARTRIFLVLGWDSMAPRTVRPEVDEPRCKRHRVCSGV